MKAVCEETVEAEQGVQKCSKQCILVTKYRQTIFCNLMEGLHLSVRKEQGVEERNQYPTQ